MSDTYKAVFQCEETGERVVWYVSSRHEARRMAREYVKDPGRKSRMMKGYEGTTWRLSWQKMFSAEGEQHEEHMIHGFIAG